MRTVAKGAAHRWTEAELDRMAQLGPADAYAADLEWRRVAPGPYRTLLDAVPVIPVTRRTPKRRNAAT